MSERAAAAGGPPEEEPRVVKRIAVRGSAVRLTILADPTVATAVAEGPHRVEQIGDQLLITSDLSQGEYTAEAPRSAFMKWVDAGTRAGTLLRVRVNPDLPLEVLNMAGSLELSGVRAPVAVGVEAGAAKLTGGAGPMNLSVASGSAEVEWQFVGHSTVTSELGSARVNVLPGSDVVVTVESTLGSAQIHTAAGVVKAPRKGVAQTVTVGGGSGTLAVTSKLGEAEVRVS